MALAAGWLLAAALPAGAVDDHRLTSPRPDERVTGEITATATVDASPIERIERVDGRLRRDGEQVGPVRAFDHHSGPRRNGRSTWTTALDPLASWAADDEAMPNGRYVIEVRATSMIHTTDWRGHAVRFNVRPPRTTVDAEVLSRLTRAVDITWEPIILPDFRGYTVQRAPASGSSWTDIAEIAGSRMTRTVDAAPAYGTWRYRVVVARAGDQGQTLTSESPAASVAVAAPGEPEPAAPTEPDGGRPASGDDGDPADADGDGNGDDGRHAPGDEGSEGDDAGGDEGPEGDDAGGDEAPDRNDGPGLGLRPGSGSAPGVSARSVPEVDSRRSARPPDAASPIPRDPGQDVFEEHLGYDLEPLEVTERQVVRESEGGMTGGGTITVMDRELALEQVMRPVAGGLLLFVVAGHVLRVARLRE